ncbi:MAG: hypothetical protein K0R38_4146 [Polyangiaceae bacterium]|jgi:signal transduction histidine kinase|nr:hypothetical protein [Polyangiaceae bacterium]
MKADGGGSARTETNASLHVERQNTDHELGRRVTAADADADQTLSLSRARADRLLQAARAATDARLPLAEQTRAAVDLLLAQRGREDRTATAEREQDDARIDRDRDERRNKLVALLALERQTTDVHLALERKSADEAVATREEFLAQVSHDLRGLMAAHRLYIALLVRGVSSDELGRQIAPQIAALSQIDAQMDRLVGDLVDIAAIEAGRLSVELRPQSAVDLLASVTGVYAPLARERGQALSVLAAPDDVKVLADGARVIQVLGNLLSNAIKFTPAEGTIRVGFDATKDAVTFSVADTGPGVPAEQAAHIFERFVGSRHSPGGLGLGLYIAERLVVAHGGRLWLDDEASQGAVFRFTVRRATV